MSSPDTFLKIFLIEDSPLLQEMLVDVLGEIDNVALVGCAEGENEALQCLADVSADIVLIDIELKQGSGIGVLDALRQAPDRFGNPTKVVLTNFSHVTMRQRCERLGTDAFFDKSLHIDQLIGFVTEAAGRKATP